MHRRGYLGLVATAGLTGCLDTAWNTVESATGTHGPQKEFGFGSPGFESAGWTENGMFEVTFGDDHDMDGWGVRYHAHSDANDAIVLREAPDFAGTDTVDLLSELVTYGSRPPSGEYHIIAYEGAFSNRGVSIIGHELGSVSFYIEPMIQTRSTGMTTNHKFTTTVENTGNSPCFVDAIAVQGVESRVGTVVGIDDSSEMTSQTMAYPPDDENPECSKLLEEFTVEFKTIPKQDLSVEMTQDHDHDRICPLNF